MTEALAYAGLAEYDAQRKLHDLRDGRLAPKMIPISDITTGAAALKIVDNFIKSPLMDKFGRGHMPLSGRTTPLATNSTQLRSAKKDPLEEEVYGTTTLDNSFGGCKLEPRLRSESQTKQRRRRFDGWLGDFGPLHTNTVRPEWNDDDAAEPDSHARGTKFEWNFEHLPGENHKHSDCPKARTSDALSETSDPVFRWLEGAV
ncbi:unnamed protein product [Peronospora destructor]|uniref:Uncharacterized protein n=1 Tax=Peronospora destructor TaxID=86335 RepID=A0AAV0TGZ6_9STRA|nr:unnamed protein product [Peronospora destructor]